MAKSVNICPRSFSAKVVFVSGFVASAAGTASFLVEPPDLQSRLCWLAIVMGGFALVAGVWWLESRFVSYTSNTTNGASSDAPQSMKHLPSNPAFQLPPNPLMTNGTIAAATDKTQNSQLPHTAANDIHPSPAASAPDSRSTPLWIFDGYFSENPLSLRDAIASERGMGKSVSWNSGKLSGVPPRTERNVVVTFDVGPDHFLVFCDCGAVPPSLLAAKPGAPVNVEGTVVKVEHPAVWLSPAKVWLAN